MPVETPVTVHCDHPGCPEVCVTVAVALERTHDLQDVRVRARAAAVDNAIAQGWRVSWAGSALCSLHARGALVIG